MLVLNANTGVSMIQDGTVTSTKIVDGSVTNTDLQTPYRMVLATAVTASGTSIDFTGIPGWAKRITIMFNGVSTNGTSLVQVQLGAGSILTTGYVSQASSGVASGLVTTGMVLTTSNNATYGISGIFTISNISSNTWIESGVCNIEVTNNIGYSSTGKVTLSGTLDRIRITTVNGTDTFDAGTINIMYEG